jgi:hypothetical protein
MSRSKLSCHFTRVILPLLCLLHTSASAALSAPTTIINNGSPSNRVDIVFVGDGYTQADLNAGLYDQHLQIFLDHAFTTGGTLADPMPRYKNFFNVHKITVASNESGADIPSQSIFRDTALDATYDTEGVERFLTISGAKADALRDIELAGTGITADVQLAAVNHSKYGGTFYDGWGVYAGANSAANDFELHEFGHAFAQLGDEYGGITTPYTGPEPTEFRNVTTDPTGQKWSEWLGFVDPRDAALTIGVHEGAAGYDQGIYRPSQNSKMRNLYRPFDAVSRQAIIHNVYADVDPLDDWLDNGSTVVDAELWAEVVDSDVIKLEWYVDDFLIPAATDDEFRAREFGYGPGTYDVRVRAYDEIINHAFTGDLLDLVRSDFEELEQSIAWTLTISPSSLGDYDGDGFVGIDDGDLLRKTFGSNQLLAADGSGNGVIDAADFVVWRKFYNPPGIASGTAPVPEPAGEMLVSIILLAWVSVRRTMR